MTQPDLFTTPPQHLARRNAPSTSKAAAAGGFTQAEAKVFAAIQGFGPDGCIQQDVLDALPDMAYPTVTARFSALADKGKIEYTGTTRPGRSGKQQRVMRAKV